MYITYYYIKKILKWYFKNNLVTTKTNIMNNNKLVVHEFDDKLQEDC